MTNRPIPIHTNHRVDLYIPSQCICGGALSDDLRDAVLVDVKTKFDSWFGGHSEVQVLGGWELPDGTPVKESVTQIYSLCNADALENYREDIDDLAIEIANRMTQDRVLRVFDNINGSLWPNTLADLKPKTNCACQGGNPTHSKTPARPLGLESADQFTKMLVIQSLLRNFKSNENGRELFCNLLGYNYADGELPHGTWPDALAALLASPPTILANHNGFKIISLRLGSDNLRRGAQRQVIQRIYKDDPTFRGLFLVSDHAQRHWEFVNVKGDGNNPGRIVLRRITVGIEGVRTATEQLSALDVSSGEQAAEVQDRHDRAFDVEALSKAFFGEIANWYFWALKNVSFPKDAPKESDGNDHVSVIRLITRLVFCWFLKGKGLISAELFDEKRLSDLLIGFTPDKSSAKGSVFYKAILQNLFFATLDMEMKKRAWRRDGQNFMAHSLYRHKKLFSFPDQALALFKDIPFLNGGLFECLDKSTGDVASPKYQRIDGFSDRPDSQPTVPDFLFFGKDSELDLSEDYGDSKFRRVKVRGLVHILNHYRFTVEESTPLEEEVALDPELAGKIFENLLAAYNPETGATARKQTGSFYTPREIVEYMVDEALTSYLLEKLKGSNPSTTDFEPRLRHLFSYEEDGHRFNPNELELLIRSIDQVKVLDPAVGSGAFPMGVLHKLVFILNRLDPGNEKWKAAQIAKLDDSVMREQAEAVFRDNDVDYGRKLYLIENCLYGVDIQPIAVQIAKMRFFISLIANQKVNESAENRGVRPLPNLETKLVAANTLVMINRPEQGRLRNPDIDEAEAELRQVRERHFLARTPATKAKCREEDQRLRTKIANLLGEDGWDSPTAKLLAGWDPYNQNSSSAFFDSEWMYGLRQGFDIVIGNPPYIRIQTLKQSDPDTVAFYKDHYKSAAKGNYDIYVVFVEAGLHLLKSSGQLAFICPHKFFNAQYGAPLRNLISDGSHLRHVVHFGDQQIFPGASIYVCLLFLSVNKIEKCRWVRSNNLNDWLVTKNAQESSISASKITAEDWNFVVGSSSGLFEKLQAIPLKLENITERIFQGIKTSADKIYILEEIKRSSKDVLVYSNHTGKEHIIENDLLHPLIKGGDSKAFIMSRTNRLILFPYEKNSTGSSILIPPNVLKKKFPLTWKYLESNNIYLKNREDGAMNVDGWYAYGRAQALDVMTLPKLFTPDLAPMAAFSYDPNGEVFFTGGVSGGYGILPKHGIQHEFLLALLNSRLIDYFHHQIATQMRGGWYSYESRFIRNLPIRLFDLSNNSEKEKHQSIIKLVNKIIKGESKNCNADVLDLKHQIDEIIYKLYQLSSAEIEIVNGRQL